MRLLASAVLACGLFLLPLTVMAQPGAGEERPFIDLDGDGTTDFTLKRTPASGVSYFDDGERVNRGRSMSMIKPKNKNEIIERKGKLISFFEKGEIISKSLDDTLKWTNEKVLLYKKSYLVSKSKSRTSWKGYNPKSDKRYIGVRIVKRGKNYYSWIRMYVNPTSEKVSVQASDYNPNAGQSIRAGQKS